MYKYLSPAKLNLFLRIISKRTDGYHTLQSIFTKVNIFDEIEISFRNDGVISRQINISENDIPYENDLNIKAANLIKEYCNNISNIDYGADIKVTKNIPMGAGLGGGSSNAATVLLALNKLWNINLNKNQLCEIGLKLGADIPFFLQNSNSAWVEEIGENIQSIDLNKYYFIVVKPNFHASTKDIFTSNLLIRNNPIINKDSFIYSAENIYNIGNSLEPVVLSLYPQIQEWLQQQNPEIKFRMTGSGSCFFSMFDDEISRDRAIEKIKTPNNWLIYACNN